MLYKRIIYNIIINYTKKSIVKFKIQSVIIDIISLLTTDYLLLTTNQKRLKIYFSPF